MYPFYLNMYPFYLNMYPFSSGYDYKDNPSFLNVLPQKGQKITPFFLNKTYFAP